MLTMDSEKPNSVKPYGFMASKLDAQRADGQPQSWNNGMKFLDWRVRTTKTIADSFWPRWDVKKGCWTGRSIEKAIDLTRADLQLMKSLVDEQIMIDPVRQGGGDPNERWFNLEDVLAANIESLLIVTLPAHSANSKELFDAFNQGKSSYFSASIPWYLKCELQRPRAYQMAFWIDPSSPPYTYLSKSAWSPSAISGHAFQGMMGCLNVFRVFGQKNKKLTPDEIVKLQMLAVDIGDRRVFAGVHYPSDNAMSWWVALDAIPYMAGDKAEATALHDFVVASLRSSEVYSRMEKSKSNEHRSCIQMLKDKF